MTGLIYPEESYKIVGACFEVYNRMGCGFLEPVYQECLEIEFEHLGIPFEDHPQLRLCYRDRVLKSKYKPDFVCNGKIVLEIKANDKLIDKHRAQVINYLNVSGFKLGLLVNFGECPKLEYERLAFTRGRALD